jgi:hypothetical protein
MAQQCDYPFLPWNSAARLPPPQLHSLAVLRLSACAFRSRDQDGAKTTLTPLEQQFENHPLD